MITRIGETGFNLKQLREIVKVAVGRDLSTETKDATEDVIALTMLLDNCLEHEVQINDDALMHKFVTFAAVVNGDDLVEFIRLIGGRYSVVDTIEEHLKLVIV